MAWEGKWKQLSKEQYTQTNRRYSLHALLELNKGRVARLLRPLVGAGERGVGGIGGGVVSDNLAKTKPPVNRASEKFSTRPSYPPAPRSAPGFPRMLKN